MMENKYRKLLIGILIVATVGVVGLLSFLAYDVYEKFAIQKANADVIDKFDESIKNQENTIENTETGNNEEIPVINVVDTGNNNSNSSSNSGSKVTYKGYNVVGKIEIPSIKIEYPILERTTPDSIELAVTVLYGPGPNQIGNTTIVGHNYRNGSFFGNNDKLVLGDKIYITDNTGTRIKYNIYNIYETSPDDSDFITRETNGKREISLSTCTDNSKARLIIWAVEE